MDITGKWALVTGASRGVGMRVARGLAGKGAKVILHSRTLAGTSAVRAEIENAGGTAVSVQGELTDESALSALIARVTEITGGQLDILYNNAGVMSTSAGAFTHPVSDYQRTLFVNAIAPIMLCDAFMPGMIERNWGRIVNVTSGVKDQPNIMPYSVSKAALDRYVRDFVPTLAKTNVLMNLMDPGWLRTDMGGPNAPGDPDSVLPGALVPVLLDESAGSGVQYNAQDFRE
ncbi:MAG: SDR family oxidoreductase [Spirochaetales bacterium]|nr:MAG: SDR family oxidoreductase [Spirochaetales bacterium]